MNAVSDPSTKKKQPSSKDAGRAKTKAFREGMQDNSTQEVNGEVVTNTPPENSEYAGRRRCP